MELGAIIITLVVIIACNVQMGGFSLKRDWLKRSERVIGPSDILTER